MCNCKRRGTAAPKPKDMSKVAVAPKKEEKPQQEKEEKK